MRCYVFTILCALNIVNVHFLLFVALIVGFLVVSQAILGVDIVCQAKSGMGKTAVFVLATLHQLNPQPGEVSRPCTGLGVCALWCFA